MSESETTKSNAVETLAMETTTPKCADRAPVEDCNLSDSVSTEDEHSPSSAAEICSKEDENSEKQQREASKNESSAGDEEATDSCPAQICELKIPKQSAMSEKEALAAECNQGNENKEKITEMLIEFDPNCYLYKTVACCEMLHCRSAALLLGGVEILFLLAWSVVAVLVYTRGLAHGPIFTIFAEILVVIAFITIVLMMYGIVAEKPTLMWPHMIMLIAMVVFGLALTVVAVCCMSIGPTLVDPVFGIVLNVTIAELVLGPIWPFTLAVIFDFGAAISIWFYVVVRACYEYLLDKEYFEQNPGALIAVPVEETTAKCDKM